jgi:hypothetical protein
MYNILLLVKDQAEAFSLRQVMRPYNNFNFIDETIPGSIAPRLDAQEAHALIIFGGVLGTQTGNFIHTIRKTLGWFLQIPILVITNQQISSRDCERLYEAGATYVCEGTVNDLEHISGLLSSQIEYTALLKTRQLHNLKSE